MELREQFEKLHPTPDGVYWRGTQGCFCYDEGCHDIPEYLEYVSKWQGFQAGHAAGLEDAAVCAWSWLMDNARKGGLSPAIDTRFDVCKAIRAMKEPK